MSETGKIAYCAPGRKALAEVALVLQGEFVREVAEHAWLTGSTDIIVVDRDKFTPLDFAGDEALRLY